jgi:hypothetical protein
MSLTAALAFTLTPDGNEPPIGLSPCIPNGLDDLIFNIFHTGGGPAADALNVLLLIPLTTSLVIASRRPAIAVAVSILLPVGIELTQTVVPGRYCAISDIVTNSTGGLLGVLVGFLATRLLRRRNRPARPGGALAPSPQIDHGEPDPAGPEPGIGSRGSQLGT